MLHKPILFFEDAIGVTAGYEKLFQRLCRGQANRVSLYHYFQKRDILRWQGNRKAAGYRFDMPTVNRLLEVVIRLIQEHKPEVLVTSDPAMLGLLLTHREESWDWGTIENLRGGVYRIYEWPCIVTYPMTAYHTEVRERDIAIANDGFADQESFELNQEQQNAEVGEDGELEIEESERSESSAAQESDEHFYAPILTRVNVGRFCLESDWAKAFRVLGAERERKRKR